MSFYWHFVHEKPLKRLLYADFAKCNNQPRRSQEMTTVNTTGSWAQVSLETK